MPAQVLADFSAALSLVHGPRLERQINDVSVLPQLLPIVEGEGKAMHGTAQFTGAANATASTEGVARSSSDADAEVEVSYTNAWAQYDKVASVSDLAVAATGSSLNPESAGAMGGDVLLGRVLDQNTRLALGVATDLYAGNPGATPPQLAGAALAIDSSGTFQSIVPGTYTEWVSVENTGALSGMTQAQVRDFLTDVYDACGYFPEFVTCPSTVWNAVRDLYADRESNTQIVEMALAAGGGPDGRDSRIVKLSAGHRILDIDGVRFVLDKYATASTMYAWNTRFVQLEQLNPYRGVLDQGAAGIQDLFRRLTDNPRLVLPREQVEGMMARSVGLRPHIKMLGDRGLSKEAVVALFAQVNWKRRNAFGKFTWN